MTKNGQLNGFFFFNGCCRQTRVPSAPVVFSRRPIITNSKKSSESYWNGHNLGPREYFNFNGFTNADYYHVNYRTDAPGWKYWDGFARTSMTDTQTPGADNQFSAITGGGVNGSDNYTVAYTLGMSGQKARAYSGTSKTGEARIIEGTHVTNTTYAYKSMRNGDGFGKKFGGNDGTEPDWFKLTFLGLDEKGDRTGASVDFYLADFRFDNFADGYIIDEWTWVDLYRLGTVCGVEFLLTSSDHKGGIYGMNTPAYFAMDRLVSSPAPVQLDEALLLPDSGLVCVTGR